MQSVVGRKCRNCGEYRSRYARDLCWKCYYTPGIREHYDCLDTHTRGSQAYNNPNSSLPQYPTTALPGSVEKIEVMEERASLGLSLFHPLDDPLPLD